MEKEEEEDVCFPNFIDKIQFIENETIKREQSLLKKRLSYIRLISFTLSSFLQKTQTCGSKPTVTTDERASPSPRSETEAKLPNEFTKLCTLAEVQMASEEKTVRACKLQNVLHKTGSCVEFCVGSDPFEIHSGFVKNLACIFCKNMACN